MMVFEQKTVLITDGDSLTGKALMKALADKGCNLVVNCRSENAGLESENIKVISVDLSNPTKAQNAVQTAVETFGRLDFLIHNNNHILVSSIEETTEDALMSLLNENTKSAFFCTQAAAAEMKKERAGRILYLSTIHDEKPTGCAFAFSVSKGAVKMLCREAALDLGEHNIQVNLIEAGPMAGDDVVLQSRLSFIYENIERKIPGHKTVTPEEIAETALSVLSSGECLNGENIRLDGGYVLHYVERPEMEAKP